jgi:hypothetical protein
MASSGIGSIRGEDRWAKAPEAGFLTVVVDADEYEKALLDPRVHQTNLEATEFLERLEREGRSL